MSENAAASSGNPNMNYAGQSSHPKTSPFEAVILSSIQTCASHINTATNQVGEENQFKAEFTLLTDFLVSVPKMSKVQVSQYIHDVENNKKPIENPIPDIKNYINIHNQNMPKLSGPKAYSFIGTLRDQDDQQEYQPPESGIEANKIDENELLPHYYYPNFLRPLPEEEEDETQDIFYDDLEACWLVPGVLPEPYWDFNMGQDFNQNKIKKLLSKAFKISLKDDETKCLIKGLKADQELVFHLGMSPAKFHLLVINNPQIAYEILICMTGTSRITDYFDVLSNMKLSPNSLEVFNRLIGHVELPQEFIQVFIKNCIEQCKTSQDNQMNKNRMVRLVCVFILSMIKSKSIQIQKDIYLEIQAFCIDFSKVKEAQAIQKLIQVEKFQSNLGDNN